MIYLCSEKLMLDFISLHTTSAGGTAREIVAADEGLQIYELILRFFIAPNEFGEEQVQTEKSHPNLRRISPRIEGRIRIVDFDFDNFDGDGDDVNEN